MPSSTQIVAIPSGPEVGNWQRFLNQEGFTDFEGKALTEDEIFGRRTAAATSAFQARHNLETTGLLDKLTRSAAIPDGFIPFVQARYYTKLWPQTRAVRRIVIHTIECAEIPTAAEANAKFFSSDQSSKASAHYFVDEDSTVQCVRDSDIAWHANQVNDDAIGIEHAGYASQTMAEWQDGPSSAILWRSAQLVARLCKRHSIEPVRLSLSEIVSGKSGLCGHVDVNQAYRNSHGHVDPGPCFPWERYLALVRMAL